MLQWYLALAVYSGHPPQAYTCCRSRGAAMAVLPLQTVCSTHACCRSHSTATAICLCSLYVALPQAPACSPACFWSHHCCPCPAQSVCGTLTSSCLLQKPQG